MCLDTRYIVLMLLHSIPTDGLAIQPENNDENTTLTKELPQLIVTRIDRAEISSQLIEPRDLADKNGKIIKVEKTDVGSKLSELKELPGKLNTVPGSEISLLIDSKHTSTLLFQPKLNLNEPEIKPITRNEISRSLHTEKNGDTIPSNGRANRKPNSYSQTSKSNIGSNISNELPSMVFFDSDSNFSTTTETFSEKSIVSTAHTSTNTMSQTLPTMKMATIWTHRLNRTSSSIEVVTLPSMKPIDTSATMKMATLSTHKPNITSSTKKMFTFPTIKMFKLPSLKPLGTLPTIKMFTLPSLKPIGTLPTIKMLSLPSRKPLRTSTMKIATFSTKKPKLTSTIKMGIPTMKPISILTTSVMPTLTPISTEPSPIKATAFTAGKPDSGSQTKTSRPQGIITTLKPLLTSHTIAVMKSTANTEKSLHTSSLGAETNVNVNVTMLPVTGETEMQQEIETTSRTGVKVTPKRTLEAVSTTNSDSTMTPILYTTNIKTANTTPYASATTDAMDTKHHNLTCASTTTTKSEMTDVTNTTEGLKKTKSNSVGTTDKIEISPSTAKTTYMTKASYTTQHIPDMRHKTDKPASNTDVTQSVVITDKIYKSTLTIINRTHTDKQICTCNTQRNKEIITIKPTMEAESTTKASTSNASSRTEIVEITFDKAEPTEIVKKAVNTKHTTVSSEVTSNVSNKAETNTNLTNINITEITQKAETANEIDESSTKITNTSLTDTPKDTDMETKVKTTENDVTKHYGSTNSYNTTRETNKPVEKSQTTPKVYTILERDTTDALKNSVTEEMTTKFEDRTASKVNLTTANMTTSKVHTIHEINETNVVKVDLEIDMENVSSNLVKTASTDTTAVIDTSALTAETNSTTVAPYTSEKTSNMIKEAETNPKFETISKNNTDMTTTQTTTMSTTEYDDIDDHYDEFGRTLDPRDTEEETSDDYNAIDLSFGRAVMEKSDTTIRPAEV